MRLNKKIDLSKEFRKNGTKSERMVWKYILKENKYHWVKQKLIQGFIVDFYCEYLKLVIEIDGDTHDTEERVKLDNKRTSVLEKKGLKILRFRNEDVQTQIYTIQEYIELLIDDRYKELYN